MDAQKELERAYRALQAFYRADVKRERLSNATLAYHGMSIAAALRFVEEGALDGSDYFVGKPIEVLQEALRLATKTGEATQTDA